MDASTGTRGGKLTLKSDEETDETFTYIETTEQMLKLPKSRMESNASGDRNRKLPMRHSLFAHVPPYIIFQHYKKNPTILPPEITKHLLWKHSLRLSPRMIRLTVLKTGYTMTTKSDENWSGTWGGNIPTDQMRSLKAFQKINHFPGILQLSYKDLLWRNYKKMLTKYGMREFDYMPTTYILPQDIRRFRKLLDRKGGIWIVKPPAGCAGSGIRVISRWNEVPKKCPLVVQRYLSRPKLIGGVKFDMRLYVLMTSVNPLRIYFYSEGLVRFATAKYVNDVRFLFDRFMHLTNTSVNKTSPKFKTNDRLDQCKGNMWSLNCLWSYMGRREKVSVPKIWATIKDMVIKTIISAEPSLFRGSASTYNSYQLLGFDIILDDSSKPWLLEVNNYPSMDSDTPLCAIVKAQLAVDSLNIVGFQIPNIIAADDVKLLKKKYDQNPLCYDHRLYSVPLTEEEKEKQARFSVVKCREDYLVSILQNLTPDDVRRLIRYEDEFTQNGRFEKIFPTSSTYKYLKFFEEVRYYNVLFDAWENMYGSRRAEGISRLKKLCEKEFHLSSIPGGTSY